MFLILLGVIDIIAGAILWLASGNPFAGNVWVLLFGIFILLKGIWSLLSSLAQGFYFEIIGMIDIIAGIFLMLSNFGLAYPFFFYFGLLVILKGFYSIIMGIRG